MSASIEIEFTKDTPVNKAMAKKGEKLSFTPDVAQGFIDAGVARIPKKTRSR